MIQVTPHWECPASTNEFPFVKLIDMTIEPYYYTSTWSAFRMARSVIVEKWRTVVSISMVIVCLGFDRNQGLRHLIFGGGCHLFRLRSKIRGGVTSSPVVSRSVVKTDFQISNLGFSVQGEGAASSHLLKLLI